MENPAGGQQEGQAAERKVTGIWEEGGVAARAGAGFQVESSVGLVGSVEGTAKRRPRATAVS